MDRRVMSHAHRVNREQTGEREEKIDCTPGEGFLSFHIYKYGEDCCTENSAEF